MLSHLVDLQLKLRRLGANARDELLNFRAAVGVENLGDGLVRGRIENVTSLRMDGAKLTASLCLWVALEACHASR